MKIRRPKRRTVAIVGLWFLPVVLIAVTASGDDSVAGGFGGIALLACPLAFLMAGWPWSASKVLCVVGAFNTLGSAALCMLAVVFVASVDGLLVLGLLTACLAGGVSLIALSDPPVPALFEAAAALITVGALTFIAFDSSNLHHVEGGAASVTTTESWSFLYIAWGFGLVMFVVAALLALRILMQPRRTAGLESEHEVGA